LTGGVIFGASALLLVTTSVLYHAARSPRLKPRLHLLDHLAIYLLIEGTHTPFALGFGFHLGSTLLYLAMGCIGVIAAEPLLESLSRHEPTWIVAVLRVIAPRPA
jgi:hemolysin III